MNSATTSISPAATHPSAIIIPALAFPASILCIPPFILHCHTRNLPATFLAGGLIVLNFFNFLNATIWPNDPLEDRYDGTGLCDLELKLYVGITAGLAGATASIFRQLTMAVDVSQGAGTDINMHRRFTQAFEIGSCMLLAVFSMGVHYIVQPSRYMLAPVHGCVVPIYPCWVSALLLASWPLIMYLIAACYGSIAIIRVVRHRRELSDVLSVSKTTKSRYRRFFGLASLLMLVNLPLSILALVANVIGQQESPGYDWSMVHPIGWSSMIMKMSFDELSASDRLNRYLQIGSGYLLFVFFGFGEETVLMYKAWLERVRITKVGGWIWRLWLYRSTWVRVPTRPQCRLSTSNTADTHSQNLPIMSMPRNAIELQLAQIDRELEAMDGQRGRVE